MIGEPERFDQDPRLRSLATRTEHVQALYAMVAEILLTDTTAAWLQRFADADIPAIPLHTLDSLLEDPHLAATGYFERREHPTEGWIHEMRPASRWSESPATLRRPAPRLGEHSVELLQELGYSRLTVDRLIEQGVTRVP